jgi:hypothetical protein
MMVSISSIVKLRSEFAAEYPRGSQKTLWSHVWRVVSRLKYAAASAFLKMLRSVGTPKSAEDPAPKMTTMLGRLSTIFGTTGITVLITWQPPASNSIPPLH